ncbi:MAG: hypothetical protein JXB30_20495 [Anaerolineae bacterium]|nr:hypothetical protein [Anaerolineae bacterium]
MTDLHQQMAKLSEKVSELEAHLGEMAGNLAELTTIMAPFLARYQDNILHYYDKLIRVQREIADLRAAQGDLDAVSPGQAVTPLDRFTDQNIPVDEQYARMWEGKKTPRLDGPQNLPPAAPELKQLYTKVIARLHPDLASTRSERARLRSLTSKANNCYVRRDMSALRTMADIYCEQSSLPAIVDEKVIKELRGRVQMLEMLITKIEGQYFDLRYGLPAKIKASAELVWAEEKRDLIAELSAEIRQYLREAQAELITLKSRL